jgi:nucleoid-associated protein YgaU
MTEKLTFQRLKIDGTPEPETFTASYNPTELAFSKSAQFADIGVPGLDSPIIQFVRGDAETLSLELFFDTTDMRGTGAAAISVNLLIIRFQRFVTVDGNLHAPPVVRITWGALMPGPALGSALFPASQIDVIVTSMARRYTLFSPDGDPLRATVTLQMRTYMTIGQQTQLLNYRSADHTRTHAVREGETLPLIAWDAYADASKWRVIADHNGLSQTRDLPAGMVLQLPPVT